MDFILLIGRKDVLTVKNCSVMLISKRSNFACRALLSIQFIARDGSKKIKLFNESVFSYQLNYE